MTTTNDQTPGSDPTPGSVPWVATANNAQEQADPGSSADKSRGPLDGLVIVDCTSYVSGPFSTMMLGDLGATVLKIENPQRGDGTRKWGPGTTGPDNAYYMSVNRNKLSVAVDLKRPEGHEVLAHLVAGADAFVHNVLDSSAHRLHIDEPSIRAASPDIVYCVVRGFPPGQDNPVFDFVMQAVTGLMATTGEPDRPPVKVPFPVLDIVAGYNAALGVLGALVEKTRTGHGRSIDVNMFEASLASMPNLVSNYLVDALEPQRSGNVHANIAPYELFETSDAWIAVGAGTQRQWERLCSALEVTNLLNDPRYQENPSRVANRGTLHKELAAVFSARRAQDWIELLQAAEVPVSRLHSLAEAVDGSDLPVTVPHPTRGPIRVARSGIRIDGENAALRIIPPVLGEHTSAVLAQRLGYTPDQLAQLEEDGVIRTTPPNYSEQQADGQAESRASLGSHE